MNCAEFVDRLRALSMEGGECGALNSHAHDCPACARRLGFHQELRETLAHLPRESTPLELDRSVHQAAHSWLRRPRRSWPVLAMRIAASLLLLAGGAILLGRVAPEGPDGMSSGRVRVLTVVVESGIGVMDEQSVLREIYGPDPLLIAGGGSRGASGRR